MTQGNNNIHKRVALSKVEVHNEPVDAASRCLMVLKF
jgi:hypothetical protein